MEFNISDLLDDYQDSAVELQPQNAASASRIRELTRNKLQNEAKQHKRSLRLMPRAVAAAAAVILLAISAVAATGFKFSDWIRREEGQGFDRSVFYGSEFMSWEIGARLFRFSVSDVSATGATVTCEDRGWDYDGELTTDEVFWLEHWNGSEYVRLEPVADDFAWTDKITVIPDGEAPISMEVEWEALYGALPSGYYRIGKSFVLTLDSGEIKKVDGYAKFRLFTEEMKPYLEKCRAALRNLLNQDHYHLLVTEYPTIHQSAPSFYTFTTDEIWKDGSDYLLDGKYILETETANDVVQRRGCMLRDGAGYGLEWEGQTVDSPVSFWKRADHISVMNFELWVAGLQWHEAIVGEVYAEGNVVILLSQSGFNGKYPYEEHVLTFDDHGNLIRLEHYYLPDRYCEDEEKLFYGSMEVLDTSAAEITRTINMQDVTTSNSIS